MGEMATKKCRDCGEEKPLERFWRRKASADGYALYCKKCFGLRNGKSYREQRKAEGKYFRPYRPRRDVPEGMKFCPSCEEVLPLEKFVRNRAEKSGYGGYCRPCHNAAGKATKNRLYGGSREYHLRRRYGLKDTEVRKLLKQQGGLCPICLSAPAEHVDHDHATGAVRAVLCFNCNGGLGQFKDDPDVLRRAAKYVEGDVWRPISIAPGVYQLPS